MDAERFRGLLLTQSDGACHELGISMLGRDIWKRERLAQLILRLVNDEGELDSAALQKRAVVQFISGAAENSSPTTASAVKDTGPLPLPERHRRAGVSIASVFGEPLSTSTN